MPVKVRIQGSTPVFPPYCVVCMEPALRAYSIEKTFSYGRRSKVISLQAPMCDEHFLAASSTSRGEILTARIGLAAGILVGLLVATGLLFYWVSSGQGSLLLNIPLAIIIGSGFFLIIWTATVYWFAPFFAPTRVKHVRNAVRLRKFWPAADILALDFANNRVAESFIRENKSLIIDHSEL